MRACVCAHERVASMQVRTCARLCVFVWLCVSLRCLIHICVVCGCVFVFVDSNVSIVVRQISNHLETYLVTKPPPMWKNPRELHNAQFHRCMLYRCPKRGLRQIFESDMETLGEQFRYEPDMVCTNEVVHHGWSFVVTRTHKSVDHNPMFVPAPPTPQTPPRCWKAVRREDL